MMMRSRTRAAETGKSRPSAVEEDVHSGSEDLASPSKEDRVYESGQVQDMENRWSIQLPVIFILCVLLGITQYLLRCDNSQLKATTMIIRELQAHENRTMKQIPAVLRRSEDTLSDPNCEHDLKNAKSQLANVRLRAQTLERTNNEQHDQAARKQDQIKALTAEKEQLEAQLANLRNEKRILAKRLGVKLATGADTAPAGDEDEGAERSLGSETKR